MRRGKVGLEMTGDLRSGMRDMMGYEKAGEERIEQRRRV